MPVRSEFREAHATAVESGGTLEVALSGIWQITAARPSWTVVREGRSTPSRVRVVAIFILVMRVVDLTWTIGPVFRHDGIGLSWMDFAAVLGMGAPWLVVFWRNLADRPVVPAHDPYFKEAMGHVGH